MDMFDSNTPQTFNAEIMIRANSEEEARQLDNLERQARENDACIRDMRSLNAKNTEVLNRVESLIGEFSSGRLSAGEDQAAVLAKLEQLQMMLAEKPEEDNAGSGAVSAKLDELAELIREQGKASNDYVHTENVKVYRNVQAAMKDELTKSSKELSDSQAAGLKSTLESLEIDTGSGAQTATLVIALLAMLFSLGGLLFQILTFFEIIVL